MEEEFWTYFIFIAKFLTLLDGGGILELFYLYCKISDFFGQWRKFGCILIVPAKFPTFLDVREILDLFYLNCKIHDIFGWGRLKIVLF